MLKTKVMLIRSDSRGLEGTVANAEHHANALLPFIKAMRYKVGKLGFSIWRQGHNVHEFTTTGGARYTLRAYTRDGEYHGVRLSKRLSRSVEEHLLDVELIDNVPLLLSIMQMLAGGKLGDDTPLLSCAN